MIIVAYDFSDNKVRTRFSHFLNKYGRKIQYSVYEIRNSKRVLENIKKEIEMSYSKKFKNSDSVLIFTLCEGCTKQIQKYGYSCNDNTDMLIFK